MPEIAIQSLDLDQLPSAEDNTFEFKSSKIDWHNLRKKIGQAASGFANSGGGCFIAGVDSAGNADGGLDAMVGRQDIRDWIDQAIHSVEPHVRYEVKRFDSTNGRGTLDAGKVVVAIAFRESPSAPHMAADSRYYIRAGAHTVPAPAFIVESLWARRHAVDPALSYNVRISPINFYTIQVGVVALNPIPAVDVEFTIEPPCGFLESANVTFPIRIPVVDQASPYYIDLVFYHDAATELPPNVKLKVKYRSVAGKVFQFMSEASLYESITPLRIGKPPLELIVKELEGIKKALNPKPKR